jgi:nitroreductase
MAETGLFDTMYTARALRRYKTDPIPDDVITKILDAAIRAPSGSNQQNWVFVVVKDAAKKKKISDIYARGAQILSAVYANRPRPPHMDEKQFQTLMNSAMYLFDHMHEAPVLLFACLRNETPAGPMPNLPPEIAAQAAKMARLGGSSIYPAVQNIILACRAFGIGTVLTTLHIFFEDEVKEILGLPREIQTYALLPMGYPINKFGPLKRRPVSEVAFLDSYGNNWKGKA